MVERLTQISLMEFRNKGLIFSHGKNFGLDSDEKFT